MYIISTHRRNREADIRASHQFLGIVRDQIGRPVRDHEEGGAV